MNDYEQTELQLTLSLEVSPVRIYQFPEKSQDLTRKEVGCGQNTPELLAKYDPNTRLWKTSQTCLLDLLNNPADGLAVYSETWPKSGMMRNGIAYQLATLAPGIHGTEFGYLPTPAKSTAKGAVRHRYFGSPTYRSNLHEYLRNGPEDPIYPHPCFLELIMGFPIGHTELAPSGTP